MDKSKANICRSRANFIFNQDHQDCYRKTFNLARLFHTAKFLLYVYLLKITNILFWHRFL